MKRKNSQSHNSDEPAAIDPQDFIRRATQSVADRKALQLCRQIERTIGLVISGELDDYRVRDLMVLSVVPAPHSNHLLVTLQASEMMTDRELIELERAPISLQRSLANSHRAEHESSQDSRLNASSDQSTSLNEPTSVTTRSRDVCWIAERFRHY